MEEQTNHDETPAPHHHHDDNDVHSVLHDESLVHDAIVDEAIHASLDNIPPLHPNQSANEELDNDQGAADPTILLASSLKQRSASSPSIILSLDTALLASKLSRTSPSHDSGIDPSRLASHLFLQNETWISKDSLFNALSSFAELVGCKAVKSRDVIRLKSRVPVAASSNADEGFYVKLRAVHSEKRAPKESGATSDSGGLFKARPVWEREVQIREVSVVLPSLKRRASELLESADSSSHCVSAEFASNLKKLDGLTGTIVGFDEKTFEEKCCKYKNVVDGGEDVPNPLFDPNLDMDRMACELFRQNDVWISRDVLYHALSCFASAFGFKIVKSRNMLVCKRYGSDNGNRNWSVGPWKVGCTFGIALKALHTEKKATESPKDPMKALGAKCRPVWEREVLIKEANCFHSGGCVPGVERVVVVKKAPKAVHPNVLVMKNAGLINLFTKIRDENTRAAEFVQYSKRIMRLLAEETAAALPSQSITVNTPTQVRYKGQLSVIDTNPDKVCLVSIIRAGDSLLESFREIFPGVTVGKMWIQRDESSAEKEAVHSCTKLPPGIDQMEAVVLCDPMLATGGSSMTALYTLVKEFGVRPERIVFANVISCPEGLDALAKNFPEVKIVTAWMDDGLNEEKFIMPGLGDYGDRFFNTVPPPAAASSVTHSL